MKILIAYHANCIDGWAAAYTAHRALEKRHGTVDITFLPVEYGKLEELKSQVRRYDKLYVVDFSLPIALLSHFCINFPKLQVTVIDHHLTAKEMYGDKKQVHGAEIILDLDESGATLTHMYFNPERAIPLLLQYVKDYDLWRFSLPDTKVINFALRVTHKSIEYWGALEKKFNTGFIGDILIQGKAIEDYHNQIVESLVEGAEEMTLGEGENAKGLCVNCSPEFASDVGHLLAEKSGTYGATWQQVNGDVKVSLRSTGDYNVALLATQFGGGGHKNAAGFTLLQDKTDAKTGVSLWSVS